MKLMRSPMFNEDTFAHIILNQPPDVIHHGDEGGLALGRQRPRSWQLDPDILEDPPGPTCKDKHAIGEKDSLIDLVRDEQHGLAAFLPDALQLALHDLAGLRVERGER